MHAGRLADLVAAVQQAEALQFHAHAFGALWSFSGCAITSDFMIDTTRLTQIFSFTNPGAAVQRADRRRRRPGVAGAR
jgi:hypothetical protein